MAQGILGLCFALLDKKEMERRASDKMRIEGLMTIPKYQPSRESFGGQRKCSVARSACLVVKWCIMDEPTRAVGWKESRRD